MKESLEIRVLDNFGLRIYSKKVLISDKKALAETLYFLTKYGIDLKELAEIAEDLKREYYDYSKI